MHDPQITNVKSNIRLPDLDFRSEPLALVTLGAPSERVVETAAHHARQISMRSASILATIKTRIWHKLSSAVRSGVAAAILAREPAEPNMQYPCGPSLTGQCVTPWTSNLKMHISRCYRHADSSPVHRHLIEQLIARGGSDNLVAIATVLLRCCRPLRVSPIPKKEHKIKCALLLFFFLFVYFNNFARETQRALSSDEIASFFICCKFIQRNTSE